MENGNTNTAGGLTRVQSVLSRLGRYKYALIVLLAGALLMFLPTKKSAPDAASQTVSAAAEQPELAQIQKELAALLSKVDGAGRVEVMLSLDYGQEYFYQSDETRDPGGDGNSRYERQTVLSQSDGGQTAVVSKVRYPVYKGAVVVCEGADNPSVELAIVQAVSRLTGLGSNKISVMKMKRQ